MPPKIDSSIPLNERVTNIRGFVGLPPHAAKIETTTPRIQVES